MELRQVEHFLAVVEHGSFTGAARASSIVQSALSTSIRNLERELGAPLFERTTRRVMLSEAGHAFLPSARRVLAEAAAATDAVRAVAGLQQGRVAIGMIQWLGPIDLPAELSTFHHRHPNIQISVWNSPVNDMLDRLRAGQLDLAYLASDRPLPPGLTGHTVYRENLVLITSPDHRFAGRERVRWAELDNEAFVEFSDGSAVTAILRRTCAELGLRRQIVGQVTQIGLQPELVRTGIGVAVMQETLARSTPGLAIVQLDAPTMNWEVSLVHRGRQPTNPAARALLDHLVSRVASG
ncbi:LysR family transcriptional regulator [Pseudonocardia spinosispora]|uniref:LysR family transcriptional regulator n=1 Tax=Pseudonocardia spinosispora TaxID=103441 RepID=UPI000426FD93|nr:LysR family transcriptional regulator [Pseudonocardia spinosispora]